MALSEQCCSTIFDDIEKIVHIPALIKPIAMSACQQIPGSGKEACGTICSALAPFGIEGPCHQVCDQAMESVHCENGVNGNEGNVKGFTFQITLPRMLCNGNGAIFHLQTEMGFPEDFRYSLYRVAHKD